MTESPVLGKVREQFADSEQSSLRNDNFLGTRSLFMGTRAHQSEAVDRNVGVAVRATFSCEAR